MTKKGKSHHAARQNILKRNRKYYQKDRADRLKSDEREKITRKEYYGSIENKKRLT